MASFQWPRRWLMTDERIDDRLALLIDHLPENCGVIVRHDAQPTPIRRALAKRAMARGLVTGVAGDVELAVSLGASLVHRPNGDPGNLPISISVHDEYEAGAARRRGADLVFVSPIHATRSHPSAMPIGEAHGAHLAELSGCLGIALGGMSEARFASAKKAGFYGWAGIDAWIRI